MAKSFMEKRVDPKWLATKAGLQAIWGAALWFLGFIFAILGIIAAAMGTAIGLEPIYWFLLAIVTFLAGMPAWLTWMWTRHLLGIEAKKEG